MKPQSILIAGAGPTGLTAAIELCRYGFKPRIIDKKDKPSPLSRAIGINPRSLELLEPSGITPLLLQAGIKIPYACFHENGRILAKVHIDALHHRYNFLLSLPQDRTETIMRDRLAEYGVQVEYGTALTHIALENGEALATLRQGEEERRQSFDLVIGADGIHSRVRQDLGIAFDGYDYPQLWSIADFDSHDWPYEKNIAHGFINKDGSIGVAIPIGPGRWRGVSDRPETLPYIPGPFTADRVHMSDSFRISVRQAVTYQKDCIYLAGDAAHVHSPVGARGMNLGIEDACDLARRIRENDLEGYTAARHPVGQQVLQISERLVKIITATNPLLKLARHILLKLLPAIPPIRQYLLQFASGLQQ